MAITAQTINRNNPLANVSGYTPERIEIDENTDTVQGRVHNIINEGSPLARQAETRAKQRMSRRGLLNSSMSVQAGQSALYDYALPIASQDAKTSFAAKQLNQTAANEADRFTAGSRNQIASQMLTGDQQLEQISAQGEQQRLNIGTETDAQSRLMAEKRDIDLELQSADAATRERLLNRQGEIDREMQELRGEQELGTIAAQGSQQRQNIEAQGQVEANLQEQRRQISLELQTADAANRERLLAQQAEIDQQLQELRGQQESDLQTSLQTMRGEQEVTLQELRGQQAQEIAEIENQNKMLLQSSQSAALAMSSTNEAIGNILANPDMTSAQKANLIKHHTTMLRNQLSVIGGIANIDLAALLEYGGGSDGTGGGSSGSTGGSLPSSTPSARESIQQQILQLENLLNNPSIGQINREQIQQQLNNLRSQL